MHFLFSSRVPRDSELGGVSLVVKQLATPGKVRDRALLFVEEQDRQEVADVVKKCETSLAESDADAGPHRVEFAVRLGKNQSYRVQAEFLVRGGMVVGVVRGVEWKLEHQQLSSDVQ